MTFTTSPRQSRDFSPPSPLLPEKTPGVARPFIYTARLRFDRFELDEAEARLTCAGQPVPLAPRPFAVLCALARTPHMLVTKNALLDAVWGHRFVTESVLKSAISEVRAALGDNPKAPRYIETVSRRGYRFIAAAAGAQPQVASALETVMSLCRGDAALADLIRTVAATLEHERLVLNDS
jgi:DNA-binding winged helix-turn-helix (wHTH) protein